MTNRKAHSRTSLKMHAFQLNSSVVCLDTLAIILCQKKITSVHLCGILAVVGINYSSNAPSIFQLQILLKLLVVQSLLFSCRMQELQQDNEGSVGQRGEKASIFVFFPVVVQQKRKYAARHKNVHLFILFVNRVLLAVLFVVLWPDVCNACICCQR